MTPNTETTPALLARETIRRRVLCAYLATLRAGGTERRAWVVAVQTAARLGSKDPADVAARVAEQVDGTA
jgi:hypothetical protein